MKNFKILGIIPARAGSKRVPGKNKKLLNGIPLVQYSIQAAKTSKLLTDIIVTSDDSDILSIAESQHILALKRPDSISGDRAPAISYVEHALSILKKEYTHIVIIQPSSPFTRGEDIDNTVQCLLDNQDADSSVSVMKLDHAIQPAKLKLKDSSNILLPYLEKEEGRMASHELPELYVRNCSVYVSKIELIKSGKIIGSMCLGYEMPRERSIDINDPIDFEFAEFLLKKNELGE